MFLHLHKKITNFTKRNMAQFITATTEELNIEFKAGVTGLLRRWSALRFAVRNDSGGVHSKAKADYLRTTLMDSCHTKYFSDSLDVEEYLLTYMEDEYSVILEDESCKEIGSILFEMFNQCKVGNFDLCRNMVAYSRTEEANGVNAAEVIDDENNYVDDSDDDENDVSEEEQE